MNCQGFCDSLHAYMAGGLSPHVRVDLESHVIECASCRALNTVAHEITCREVADFLNEYLDGTQSPDRRAVFERHLSICEECRNYLEGYETTVRLGRAAFAGHEEDPATGVPERLLNAILAARKKER